MDTSNRSIDGPSIVISLADLFTEPRTLEPSFRAASEHDRGQLTSILDILEGSVFSRIGLARTIGGRWH